VPIEEGRSSLRAQLAADYHDRHGKAASRNALSEAERKRLESEVEASFARARIRMDAEAAERTARALTRRTLRELLDLPRLTLL
jgi:hypothetical protein